jgi:ketosteroid isomerase-like protein
MNSHEIETQTRAFYEAVDANDPAAFERHLTPNAVFAFNDLPPVSGVQQITDFVAAWKANFAAVIHDLANIAVDEQRGRIGLEIVVTYVFTDDRKIAVKGSAFLDFQGGLISAWNVYVDTTNLA